MKAGVNGVTTNTPKNILFGAGTIHKNLKYATNTWNFDTSIVGATNMADLALIMCLIIH